MMMMIDKSLVGQLVSGGVFGFNGAIERHDLASLFSLSPSRAGI